MKPHHNLKTQQVRGTLELSTEKYGSSPQLLHPVPRTLAGDSESGCKETLPAQLSLPTGWGLRSLPCVSFITLFTLLSLSSFALVFSDWRNKFSQIQGLKITEIHSLPILEAIMWKLVLLRCQQGYAPTRNPRGEPASCLFHPLVAASISWLVVASRQSLPPSSCCLLLFSVCPLSLPSSYKDTCDRIQCSPGQSEVISPITNLITSAKNVCSHKIIFTDSRDYNPIYNWVAIVQPTVSMLTLSLSLSSLY